MTEPILSDIERRLIAAVYDGDMIDTIVRKSPRQFDLTIRGQQSLGAFSVQFSSWLPLAAIHDLTDWTAWPIAKMTDYPAMAMGCDWSAVRDSSEVKIWIIFGTKVLREFQQKGKVNALPERLRSDARQRRF